jgi:hypothetical protein
LLQPPKTRPRPSPKPTRAAHLPGNFGIHRIWGSFMGIYWTYWGFIYIYIAKKMRWFAIFIRENVGYNRIYWGIYLEFIGDVLGIEWELIWDLIRFLEIRWDFIVIECDSIGFHLIYCKHLHPNFCGWWF